MKKIEVDFNMCDEAFFVAPPTDQELDSGDAFLAYDVEGNEMIAVVNRVSDSGTIYFSAVDADPVAIDETRQLLQWTVSTTPTNWRVCSTPTGRITFAGNKSVEKITS